jgi:ferredoxin-NADP reductase
MIMEEARKTSPRKMTLLYGGRTDKDIAYLDEIASWSDELNVKLGLSRAEEANTSLGWEPCRITNFLEKGEWEKNTEFYICGNGSMVKSVHQLLEEKGIAKENIFMERFN